MNYITEPNQLTAFFLTDQLNFYLTKVDVFSITTVDRTGATRDVNDRELVMGALFGWYLLALSIQTHYIMLTD